MKTGTVENILACYEMADETDKSEGMRAYEMYRMTMLLFSDRYHCSVEVATGIFAALSPMNDYKGNLRSLKTMLEAKKHGILDHPDRIVVTTTNPNKNKAILIARERMKECPDQILTSNKCKNFYYNICYPQDIWAVTIDRHAMSIWQGKRDPDGRVGNDAAYERVANDYRMAASKLVIRPNQLQATTWFAWKRINGIVYDAQLDLFQMPDNTWRSITSPDEVEAFPFRAHGEKSKYASGAEKRKEKRNNTRSSRSTRSGQRQHDISA